MNRLVRLAVAALTALVLVPASADAALQWSTDTVAPQSLSPAGVQSTGARIASDAAGDAIATWVQCSQACGIFEAYRPAGGNFGPEHEVDVGTTVNAENPWVAMDPQGDAIIAWDSETYLTNASVDLIHYAYRPAGPESQRFQHWVEMPQTAADTAAFPTEYQYPRVAMDAAGDAVMAFDHIGAGGSPSQPSPTEVYATYRPAGTSTTFDTTYDQLDAPPFDSVPSFTSVAMNARGDAVIAWEQGHSSLGTADVVASYRPAGPSSPYSFSVVSTEGAHVVSEDPSATIDASGNATVAWDQSTSGQYPYLLQAADRPYGGSFGTPYTVSSTSVNTNGAELQPGPSGDTWLQWVQSTSLQTQLSQVTDAYRPAGGSFGAPGLVTSSTFIGETFGVDGQDRPTELSISQDASFNATIQATSSDAGPGAFAAPSTLASSVDIGSPADGSTAPVLSVSAAGPAVAVWQEVDNGDLIIKAAYGTPPGAVAPPAPPPPPPPVTSAIALAAPLQSGQAVVLTANVSSDVTKIAWSFSGGASTAGPFTAESIASLTQRSIRLRPDPGAQFKVTLTAYGAFGQTTSSVRTFLMPKAPSDAYSKTVDSRMGGRARVFAIGDQATLLGNTKCGALTVYTGRQQISGCLRPITSLSDIPSTELASIQTMAATLGLDPSDPRLTTALLQRVDGYVGVGPAMLNNQWKVSPSVNASLVSFPSLGAFTSSHASIDVGGLNFGGLSGGGGFSLDLDPGKLDIPLGSLPKPQLPDIGGFPLVGDWNIDLGSSDATIDASLQLPSWLSLGGVPLHVPITFKATPSGLVLNSLDIGPINAAIGPLGVSGLELKYDRPTDTWTGSGKVCLLTGLCLDMTPPRGEIKIVHGALNFAGATLDFPAPGVPLFAGVNMTNISFGMGLDPTRLKAGAGISVLDLVQLQGELVAAFPTAGHPFILRADEVGSDFPPDLYGKPFTEPTIGASADVSLNLPVIGYVTLGKGYLLYEVPDFIAVGGSVDLKLVKVIDINGAIEGEANFRDRTVNLHAEANACLLVIHKICASAAVNISRGPNSAGGAGGCIGIGGLNVGGGVLWSRIDDPIIWPFDGCKWSRFKIDVNPAVAAVSGQRTIVVKRGQPNPALKIFGRKTAPLVRVTGPGGQSLTSTDSGFDHSPGGKIRILRYEGQTEAFTVIGLENARPGTYTVTALPGSSPFTDTETAADPPAARVSATVGGSDERRTLRYDIRRRPDQTVTFVDSGTGRAATSIGKVSGGGHGTLRFTAPPGRGRHTIYAQFSLAGLPAERIAVAHYTPPSPTLATPRHLHATRRKTRLTVSWGSVTDATAYEVTLTDQHTGRQRLVRARAPHVAITGVPPTFGGTLAVRAVEPRYARASLTARTSLKRLATPVSPFKKLGKCKVSKKHKLSCTGGPAIKKTKTKAKPKARKRIIAAR
jgi:hypothetical protein